MPDATNLPPEAASKASDPVAAYRRANEALATAASRFVPDSEVASNPSADD